MNKSTMSILLASMMAVSGLAAAQTTDVKSGTNGGAGPMTPNAGSTTSRAEVKSQVNTTSIKSGIGGGEAASINDNPNTKNLGAPGTGKTRVKMTPEERKMKADERRAARQARMAGKGATPDMELGPRTATSGNSEMNNGAKSATIGQGQKSQKQGNGAN